MSAPAARDVDGGPQRTLGMGADEFAHMHDRLRRAGAVIARLKPPADQDVLVLLREGNEPEMRVIGQRLAIGRDSTADWRLDDALLSRRHFEIVRDALGLELRDLGSQNRTRVNGTEIAHREIASGDLIQAGNQTFVVLTRLDPPGPG